MEKALIPPIHEEVKDYLKPVKPFKFASAADLEKLVGHLKASPRLALGSVNDIKLRGIAAICALGPKSAGRPEAALINQLEQLLKNHFKSPKKQAEKCFDVAVAYGLGWQRELLDDRDGWSSPWQVAREALAADLLETLRGIERQLDHLIPGYGSPDDKGDRNRDKNTELLKLAISLLHALIHPERFLEFSEGERASLAWKENDLVFTVRRDAATVRPGRKLVFIVKGRAPRLVQEGKKAIELEDGCQVVLFVRDDGLQVTTDLNARSINLTMGETAWFEGVDCFRIFECSCGTESCREKHRLESWRPHASELRDYILKSIRGPIERLKTGSILESLLFGFYLKNVRKIQTLFTRCPKTKKAVDKYSCPVCPEECDISLLQNDTRDILIGTELGVGFQPVDRYRCTHAHCRNVYDVSLDAVRKTTYCGKCDELLLTEATITEKMRSAESFLKMLRLLVKERNNLRQCGYCGEPLTQVIFCPVCADKGESLPSSPYGGLPQRSLNVSIKFDGKLCRLSDKMMDSFGRQETGTEEEDEKKDGKEWMPEILEDPPDAPERPRA